MQVPHYGCAALALITRLSLTDIGTGVSLQEGVGCAARSEAERSFHVLELSNWSLRWDSANLAKHVAYLRREHKRARADLQVADQDTSKYGTNLWMRHL